MQNFLKQNWFKLLVMLLSLVACSLLWHLVMSPRFISKEPLIQSRELTEDEINLKIDDALTVLMNIYYISLTDILLDNSDTFLLDSLQEAMNDMNKLSGLLYKTESLSKSDNEVLSTTGLALNLTVQSLINSNKTWIEYLRTVDINNIKISEFQYQIALYQSSSHDAYLRLAEGVSLLPVIAVKFSKEDGGTSVTNENIKKHLLSKIDELFNDILVSDDLLYKQNKNRNVVAVIIRGYKDFFNSSSE